jgi:Xaa-Pro aminopeptidase
MISFDNGRTLQPFFQMKSSRQDPLVVYLAARSCGYWSEAMTTLSSKPYAPAQVAEAELVAMIGKLQPGMSGADVSALADASGTSASRHPIVKDRAGYGIGLPLEEMSIQRGDTKPVIQEGGVYALHAGIDDEDGAALTSAVVHVADDGARVLCRYSNPS